jgi:hypothetical protein
MDNDIFFTPPSPPMAGVQHDSAWRRKFGALSWEKGDFDGNGMTDLLINGYVRYTDKYSRSICFVILNIGGDSCRILDLTHGSFEFYAGKKIILDGHADIAVLHFKMSWSNRSVTQPSPTARDTLTYAFQHFVERKPFSSRSTTHHKPHSIWEIKYCRWGSMSLEGPFGYIIHGDSARLLSYQALIEPKSYLDSGGTFLTCIDTPTANQLYSLLDYLDIPSLKKEYSVPWTDDWETTLHLLYKSGKAYTIEDNGQIGTYGLAALHDLLADLRYSQRWIKIAPFDENADPCP